MDREKLMDKRQREVHKKFPATNYLNNPDHVERVMDWVTFFRRNPSRFIEFYFGIKLHLYQHILLFLMDIFPSICIVASRSDAKSYIVALYACKEAVLRPGAKIVIASATKGQARLIVSEKIKKEIMQNSKLLEAEISGFKDSQNEIEVNFYNGSSIVVVPANDNARGRRATVLIYEEFRMILKNIIDSVLSPFLYVRQTPFTKEECYEELAEEPKEIYISSAWYRTHWMWGLVKQFAKDMLMRGSSLVIGMDYSIALRHKIKTRKFLLKERKKLDSVAWAIEYENQMIAENAKAYFTYEMLNRNQKLKCRFYPRRTEDVLSNTKNRFNLPKQQGEVRVISCDIASEGGKENDNSVFACIRLLPESTEYKTTDRTGEHIEMKRGYRRQVCYIEAHNGGETTGQAIRIKQLFEDFNADYCVLDTRNVGVSIYDDLAKVLYDEERNIEYKPWKCMNDEKLASRIMIAGQEPVVFSIKASLELNSNIAVCMRKTLENRMIEFLVSHTEGVEELPNIVPNYATADVDTQIFYERPYLETTAMINEMINLEYTVMNQTGLIRIEEKSGARKDRYTAVSYGNYFAELLEKDLFSDNAEYEFLTLCD